MDLRVYFELDKDYHPDQLESLVSCDAIHLSGGNTYYFLYWLHKREMLESLRQYVEQGGVLIGVSTDFIMMSPDISICPLYINEAIEVDTDFSALNLVDFAFVPHYQDRKVSLNIAALQKYSRDHQIVVLACQDSGGIVVTEDKVKCIGDVIKVDER